ncbi:MAG: HAMP domain-containing sensor histidine kinase [Nitrospirota bacterium]
MIVDIAKSMLRFEDEIARKWHDLYAKSRNIHRAKERSVRDFKVAVKLLLTSLSDGNFDGYLKRIQKRGIEFARSREIYENLIFFFNMYEEAALPCLQQAYPERIDIILRTLEHLYHGVIAIMSRAYFIRLGKDKEKFLSTLVHDLRNPLIGLTGFAKMMVEKKISKGKEAEFLRIIKESGEKMSVLIDNALIYGRLKSGKAILNVKDVNIVEIAKEAVIFLLPEIERNALSVTINRHQLKDCEYLTPIEVEGDRELILRAMGNYLSNAIKYAKTRAAVTIQEKRENVLISIKDDGPGIPQDQLSLIFENYYVMPGGKPGIGIGLSSVKMIANLHRGKAWAESDCGSGSTFYLILPKKQETDH